MIEDSRTANWERACQLHELLGVLATLIERHGPEGRSTGIPAVIETMEHHAEALRIDLHPVTPKA